MMRKKQSKKLDELIISKHEVKEEDIIFEQNNIVKYNENANIRAFSFQTLLFPMFEYEKSSLLKLEYDKPPEAECFTKNFDEKGNFLTCGYSIGFINVFNLKEKKLVSSFKPSSLPITCIKWNNKKFSTLLVSSSDGAISHWHSSSGKILHSIPETKNSINSCDFSSDYRKFCTGGKDVKIRLYDEEMKTLISTMKPYDDDDSTGRIFSVKFNPENSNSIISGGWDKNINIFDTREGKLSNSIYGPKICGDGLDIKSFYILSTSWEGKNVQIWDTRTLKCVTDGVFENGSSTFKTNLYTGKFNKSNYELFAVGGVNKNIIRIFDFENYLEDRENENNQLKCFLGDKEIYTPCYCMDFARYNEKIELFAYGCGDGGVRVFNINYK